MATSFLESPTPNMQKTGVEEIKAALKHHASVVGADQPPGFFNLLDMLPPRDPGHIMNMTDGKLMEIAIKLKEESNCTPGQKGHYSPNTVGVLLHSVLDATQTGQIKSRSDSQRVADQIIAITAQNYARGIYTCPDLSSLNACRVR